MPDVRDYPQATSLDDTDAFPMNRIGVGSMYVEAGDVGIGEAILAFEFLGATVPITIEELGAVSFPRGVTFPGNFAGSTGAILVNPTATFTAQITKNGTVIGGMTVSTSGVYSFTSSGGSAVAYVVGDTMTVVAPASPDATASGFLFSFLGAFS